MKTTKQNLRTQKRTALATLARTHPGAGQLLVERAITLHLEKFSRIAFYHPLPHEFDPLPLVDYLAACGAIILLPRVAAKDSPLVFHVWKAGDTLSPDALGIMAPLPAAPVATPDLIVAPLLAFDRAGNRLGRGGGYYDRTLATLHGVNYAGLAYAEQEAPAVPAEVHDMQLDFVITPAGIIECGMIDKKP